MKTFFDIAIVGATGTVGETMIPLLEERKFPVRNLYPLASSRSVGHRISFQGEEVTVRDLAEFDFSQAQIALFSAGSKVSALYAPKAASAGCLVIDNTAQFRYEPDIPLIVPEINPHALMGHSKRNIIANPNCSTTQMVMALKPLYDAVGIERVNVCTYQAVSGTGKEAIEELSGQTIALLNGKEYSPLIYSKQIAFNVLPHIDEFQDNGYTREEMKMVWETRKILEDEDILVNPTAVRVPVFYGHSEAVHVETSEKISARAAQELLNKTPGIAVLDDPRAGGYPTAVTEGTGSDAVFIGRIREDISHPRGLNLWIVSDNTRKGAALNSIQIAEELINQGLRG